MADVGTESRYRLGSDRIKSFAGLWLYDGLSGACCRYRANFGGIVMHKFYGHQHRWFLCASVWIAIAFLTAFPMRAKAQGFTLPNNSVAQGHLLASPVPGAAGLPVGVSCTIAAGSSDSIGACTTTSTSGSVTFGTAFNTAPRCVITDLTANAATNAFTVSATAITLGTVTSAHLLQWICIGNVGG